MKSWFDSGYKIQPWEQETQPRLIRERLGTRFITYKKYI